MLSALVQHVPLGKPLFRSVLPDLVGMNHQQRPLAADLDQPA
jgi:hypothetical protein